MAIDKSKKIKSFTDLEAWKQAHNLVLAVYQISQLFPKEEMFGLTNQIRRAVVSITSNIAEGFARNFYKEKLQFYYIARGSLVETQNQLLIARDLKYLDNQKFKDIADQTVSVHKLINSLIKSIKSQNLIP